MNTRNKLGTRSHAFLAVALLASMALTPAAWAAQVQLELDLDKPFVLVGKKQTAFLRIGLTGAPGEATRERAPVNVSLVLDKSGSMIGEKIEKAKESAIQAIMRMDSRDILSFITYDSTVNVLIPATRVSDKETLIATIRRIEAGGNTALFAGVSKGAEEVRKFKSEGTVNRVILLSDGLANVGPSSTEELAALGASMLKEGISVTTIGLGSDFNSALMTALADKSDGSFYFAEQATDLTWAYEREFGRALSVAARRLQTRITCASGVRPIRVLGREAEIRGQVVSVYINDLYCEKEKHILLEVELPAGENGARADVASVTVTFANPITNKTEQVQKPVDVRFTESASLVEEKTNSKVVVDTVELMAVQQRSLAYALRDQGKVEEASSLLLVNRERLEDVGNRYRSQKLLDYAKEQTINFSNSGAYVYDPTNGTVSFGDVWRVKQ